MGPPHFAVEEVSRLSGALPRRAPWKVLVQEPNFPEVDPQIKRIGNIEGEMLKYAP